MVDLYLSLKAAEVEDLSRLFTRVSLYSYRRGNAHDALVLSTDVWVTLDVKARTPRTCLVDAISSCLANDTPNI